MIWFVAGIAILLFILAIRFYPAYRFLEQYHQKLSAPEEPPVFFIGSRQIPEAKLSVDVYASSDNSRATLIVVPGLHPRGIHDSRFHAFASLLAGHGFHVIAADLAEFKEFQITMQSVDQVASLVGAVPVYFPEFASKKMGLLAISYGAGPAFIAATRDEVKPVLHYFISIGGYYDLQHAMEFNLTGSHGKGQPREPHSWGRLIFAFNRLDEITRESTILREALELRLNLKEKEAAELEKDLSVDEQLLMAGLLNGLSEKQREQFVTILARHREETDRLSPKTYLSSLNPDLRIYLLHGLTDSSIPFEETLELEEQLRKMHHRFVKVHVTGALSHVDTLRVGEWKDSLQLLNWCRSFLNEAR